MTPDLERLEALPTFDECDDAVKQGIGTPLHHFIHDNEPAGSDDQPWRKCLAELLQWHLRTRLAALEQAGVTEDRPTLYCFRRYRSGVLMASDVHVLARDRDEAERKARGLLSRECDDVSNASREVLEQYDPEAALAPVAQAGERVSPEFREAWLAKNDPIAQSEPLTPGQQIVADYENDMIAEPCELAMSIDAALDQTHRKGAEAAIRVIEGGSFLHDDAPGARFAREVVAAIRRELALQPLAGAL